MESYLALVALLISPIFVAGVGLWILRWIEGEHRRKSPVSRTVSRYAGYTLSKEIEKLDERLSSDLTTLILIPATTVPVLSLPQFALTGGASLGVFLIPYMAAIGFFIVRLFRTAKSLRRKRKGLAGEQVVGNELMGLLRHGFHVFHDFPLDGENIDHVAVGPQGVFAIETKYKRKLKGEKDGHYVYYNGERLKFGDYETADPLIQSRRQAKKLSEKLCSMFDVHGVTPVVVFPGWYVQMEKGTIDVLVLNETGAPKYIAKQNPKISPEIVSRIAKYLEERCSDVKV